MKLDTKTARKVQKLRAKGYSYRDIAKVIRKDVKSVYLWAHYELSPTIAMEDL